MAASDQEIVRNTLKASVVAMLAAGFFGLFVNAFQLVVPLYMLQIYDRVIVSKSMDTLIMLTVVALGCLLFLAAMDFIRSHVFIIIGERMARRLGAPTMRAAIRQSLKSGQTDSGQALRDLHELRQFATGGPIGLPFDAAFAPLFLLVLYLIHPAYGIVASAGVALLLGVSLATEYLVRRPSQSANEAAMRSHNEIGVAIRNAEVIDAMGMADVLANRWKTAQDQALRMVGIGNAGARAIMAGARALRMALQVTMLATGAMLVIADQVSPGTIVAATIIMGRLLMPFEQAIDGWRGWNQAIGAFRRLRSVLEAGDTGRQVAPAKVGTPRLSAEALSFIPARAEKAVLRNVGFTLEPGEVLAVIGPSGAGKSTLARLLVGIWEPTTGGVFLDGQNVAHWERTSFGEASGYLPQQHGLLEGTIGENIARFRDVDPADIIAAARLVNTHEMIGRLPLGYETPIGDGGFALSGGQRQRIALTRAFFGNPSLVVMDEPNTHLDGEAENDLLKTVNQAQSRGTTVVVVSHRPAMLSVCDKVLVLRDGLVESFGPPAQAGLQTRRLIPATKRETGKITHLSAARKRAG